MNLTFNCISYLNFFDNISFKILLLKVNLT